MRLTDYLATHEITQQAFAERVGCTQGRISQLIAGALPSFELARTIAAVSDGEVSMQDWPESSEAAA